MKNTALSLLERVQQYSQEQRQKREQIERTEAGILAVLLSEHFEIDTSPEQFRVERFENVPYMVYRDEAAGLAFRSYRYDTGTNTLQVCAEEGGMWWMCYGVAEVAKAIEARQPKPEPTMPPEPSAFPSHYHDFGGLTKREYIATHILSGAMADYDSLARMIALSVQAADALLECLAETQEAEGNS